MIDRLGLAGHLDAGIVAVVGGDADAGAADRDHAGDAPHLLGDRIAALEQLAPAEILDLDQAVAAVARIDGAGVDGLGVDDRGADDQADRDRELGDDEDVAQQARAGRLGRATCWP